MAVSGGSGNGGSTDVGGGGNAGSGGANTAGSAGGMEEPGIYPVGQGLTALSATVLAGGFTDFASLGRAKIVRTARNGRTEVVKVDLGKILKGELPDLALRDGDRVDVPRRLF